MVAQYIPTQPILDLCEWSTRRPGVSVSRKWQEQAGIEMEGENKRAEAAVEAATDSWPESDLGGEDSIGASRLSGADQSGLDQKGECPYIDNMTELRKGENEVSK